MCEPAVPAANLSREEVISLFHQKQKQLSAALTSRAFPNAASRAARVRLLRAQLSVIGLDAYQRASLQGESASHAAEFDSSVWVLAELTKLLNEAKDASPGALALLDVGAIVHRFPDKLTLEGGDIPLSASAIDLNPRDERVQKADFFEFAAKRVREGAPKYHAVCLCLCVNFVGSPALRGEMLRLAGLIANKGGLLFLTLPRACVDNSRFMDEEALRHVLQMAGWDALSRRDSAKLVLLVCRRREGEGEHKAGVVRKNVVRKGSGFNNFSIELGTAPKGKKGMEKKKEKKREKNGEKNKTGGAARTGLKLGGVNKPTTSNQRKRARKKLRQQGRSTDKRAA